MFIYNTNNIRFNISNGFSILIKFNIIQINFFINIYNYLKQVYNYFDYSILKNAKNEFTEKFLNKNDNEQEFYYKKLETSDYREPDTLPHTLTIEEHRKKLEHEYLYSQKNKNNSNNLLEEHV